MATSPSIDETNLVEMDMLSQAIQWKGDEDGIMVSVSNGNVYMISLEMALDKEQQQKLTEHFIRFYDEMNREPSLVMFPATIRQRFHIRDVYRIPQSKATQRFLLSQAAIVADKTESSTKPLPEFMFLESVYRSYSACYDESFLPDFKKNMEENKEFICLDGVPATTYLFFFAEYLKDCIKQNRFNPAEKNAVIEWTQFLLAVVNQDIPQSITPMHALAKTCNVTISYKTTMIAGGIYCPTFAFKGQAYRCAIFNFGKQLLSEKLKVYEVVSQQCCGNLARLFDVLGKAIVEIAAGRGQLTAGLTDKGVVVSKTTDIKPCEYPWKGVLVSKRSAEKVVKRNGDRVIYLAGQPTPETLISMIKVATDPILILCLGNDRTKEPQLACFTRNNKLVVINLTVEGYAGYSPDSGVRLYCIGYSAQQIKDLKQTISPQFIEDSHGHETRATRSTKHSRNKAKKK
ncbi:MAG: hypothetical protein ACPGUD_08150 [Parashewanella sp.]